ncbi:hypothetical protein YWIDRAFT_06340 [Streptomyces sp. SceaMP-e96]|nr:hypothetical protein YWIDRAFT_06340 [Streptomyces sp. SceaMP-e96]
MEDGTVEVHTRCQAESVQRLSVGLDDAVGAGVGAATATRPLSVGAWACLAK